MEKKQKIKHGYQHTCTNYVWQRDKIVLLEEKYSLKSVGKLGFPPGENLKVGKCFSACTKLKSKLIKDLTSKTETQNLLEDKVGKKSRGHRAKQVVHP